MQFDLKSIRFSLSKHLQPYRMDILIALILAIASGTTAFLSAQTVPTPLLTDFYAQDAWFGSDLPTVFGNITSFKSDLGRNNKHPLFPILIFPLIFGTSKLLHLDSVTATRLVLALTAAVWMAALYSLFRLMSCQRLDAILFSLVGGVSAAMMFWFVVPDSFPFASLTILLGLVFVVLTQLRTFSPVWYVAVGVMTVSITITNWMVGLLVTIVNYRWKKAAQITVLTLLVTTGLWIAQRVLFTNTGFPFQPKTFIGEKKFMTGAEHSSVLSALSSFVYQTIVMPAVQFTDSVSRPGWPTLEVNPLLPASGSLWGMVAAFAWTSLLVVGIWGFWTTKTNPKFRIVLGLTILGQLLIHSVYGTQETFLYSSHFAPLLLSVAAFSSLTRLRWLGLGLACVVVVSAGINNRSLFNQVVVGLLDYGTPRQQVQAQMQVRPADYWARSEGHIVLGTPGSEAEEKAYYEPGGSFSPRVGSFGVAIWMVDRDGRVKTTSDSVPLNQIQQKLTDGGSQGISGVMAKTDVYQASWSAVKPDVWQLNLSVPANSPHQPALVVRSVGPAGGEIKTLNWDGKQLLINDRWVIRNLPTQVKVYLGSERSPNWVRQQSPASQWQDEKGWGYARLLLGAGTVSNLVIEDLKPDVKQVGKPDGMAFRSALLNPALNLPNAQFTESFNAQIAHLKMGIVGNQTRPGDPIDYSLPRFRDGAYAVVALARSGQLDLARQLAPYFAATDFLNGIQPEADIPALGIWVLTTIADQVNQSDYDQSIWQDVRRKAELVVNMQTSNRPGYPVIERSRFPFSEHPDFLDQELVAGKMAASPGLIGLDATANLMSYRALLEAASLADRLKQPTISSRWRSQASELQTAWQQVFDQHFAGIDATYTNGIWPSGIAAGNQSRFLQGLETRWQEAHDERGNLRRPPEETNFNLAEAHQWLLLNRVDRVWSTLKWFWEHQASPGLYTWWGNHDGENTPASLSQWYRFRGWVNPPHVTPYYWTAAEMLLLQLDMLAYVDQTTETPTLVIGAGIPREWMSQPMNVKGLLVKGNLVNWAWDGKQMTVQLRGKKMNVKLGESFPKNALLNSVVLNESIPDQPEPSV